MICYPVKELIFIGKELVFLRKIVEQSSQHTLAYQKAMNKHIRILRINYEYIIAFSYKKRMRRYDVY